MQNSAQYISTRQLSRLIGRSQGHIRNAFSKNGHFWNVRPRKNPVGGLSWPIEPFLMYRTHEPTLVM